MASDGPNILPYRPPPSRHAPRWIALALAIFLPTITTMIVVTAGEWPRRNEFVTNYLWGFPTLAICLTSGLVPLWHVGDRGRKFVVLAIVYTLLQMGWVVLFSIGLEGAAFGHWL